MAHGKGEQARTRINEIYKLRHKEASVEAAWARRTRKDAEFRQDEADADVDLSFLLVGVGSGLALLLLYLLTERLRLFYMWAKAEPDTTSNQTTDSQAGEEDALIKYLA